MQAFVTREIVKHKKHLPLPFKNAKHSPGLCTAMYTNISICWVEKNNTLSMAKAGIYLRLFIGW